VFDAVDNFAVTATLWRCADPSSRRITGGVLSNDLAPQPSPTITENVISAGNGSVSSRCREAVVVQVSTGLNPGYEVPFSNTARSPDGAERTPGQILNESKPLPTSLENAPVCASGHHTSGEQPRLPGDELAGRGGELRGRWCETGAVHDEGGVNRAYGVAG
jgi:hypothetical protein